MTCGNKKRILFVMQSLYDGGAEKLLVDMLNNFDYSKYDIDLLLEHDFGNYANLVPLEVRKIILFYNINRPLLERMIGKIMSYFGLYYFYILFFRRQIIIDKMKGEKYDTIISFLEGRSLVYHSFILKQGIRHLSWVHVDLFNFHWTKRYFKSNKHEKKCYELMDDVIFVSNDAKNKFQQLFNVTTSTKVIYNLIDCKTIVLRANEFKVEKRKFTVCLVGRLVRQKQFDSIIHNQASRAVNMKFLGQAVAGLKVKIISVLHNLPGTENIRYNKQSLLFQVLNRRISFKWLIYLLLLFFYPITRFLVKYTTKRKYKSIYKYSDALVLLSDAYIPIYRSIANLKDSSKMVSIPNFLSFDYVERNYSKTNELLIVARFDEISKRILLALKIWKHFLSTYDVRDWCLTIVGYGEWESVYKDFINKNDIVNVKLVGRDDSKKYFERSSILMFTSLLEGAPLSLLEAMQMKVVPIAFDDCMAIRGFLINDVNSKVIKSLDISEYSRSIYDLITNEKLRCKLSENAFNCLHYFTVKNVMLRWVDLYNSLLK